MFLPCSAPIKVLISDWLSQERRFLTVLFDWLAGNLLFFKLNIPNQSSDQKFGAASNVNHFYLRSKLPCPTTINFLYLFAMRAMIIDDHIKPALKTLIIPGLLSLTHWEETHAKNKEYLQMVIIFCA